MKTPLVWIITYTHSHGTDVWPVFTLPGLVAEAKNLADWEPDSDSLESTGPWTFSS